MKEDKTLGIDGYTANFFKKNRNIVGADVTTTIRYRFDAKYMYELL